MSAPELKNCPFCGSPPEYEPWHGGLPTKMMIMCGNRPDGSGGDCMVSPMVTGETMDEAAENWNRRTDLSQASVAAALEAAAKCADPTRHQHDCGCAFCEIRRYIAEAIRALITPDQHDAIAAHVAAEVAKARAEDAAKIDKATYTLKAVEWHLRQQDHSGHIHGVVVAAIAQIGAKP